MWIDKNKVSTCFLGCIAIGVMTLISACDSKKEPESVSLFEPTGPSEQTSIHRWPNLEHKVNLDSDVEERINVLLEKMTLEQKVGQMTQAEITWVTPADVKRLHLGSVLNGGGSFLHGKRHASVDEWVQYMDEIYDASMDTSDGGLAIPVTYGIDAVHGNNKFGHATIFPHNIGLGATRNVDLMRKIGEITALEVLAIGADWTFAPTLAVAQDLRWGRSYESFAEQPELIAEYGKALVEGVQGVANTPDFLGDDHVYATAKHWVGDGGTDNGIDQGDTTMDEEDLVKLQASAYFPTIESGVQSIMASHNFWKGEKLHGHKYLLTDVLKERLGFDGFIIGDWNAHGNVKGCTNDSCPQSVNAGLDMFMVVEDYEAFINNTVKQVNDGIIPMSRIDDAVRRILRVKIRSGLFDKGRPSSRPHAGDKGLMGNEAHREVARQAVRESLVLLKNNDNLLPLNPTGHILIAGDGADNMAKQSGGWTISWQSTEVTKDDFTGASTLLDGFKQTIASAGGTMEYQQEGQYKQKPDAAIVVFGESPYAEWFGDIKTIAYQPDDSKDAALLRSLKAQGIPVVAVFLTGRPLWVNKEINASDAFVAAWLPGSEGKAVAEVLFANADGSVNYDFKGKLSFSWPKLASQVVLNSYSSDYDPLFPYGYGLNYADEVQLALLSEENDYRVQSGNDAEYPLLVKGLNQPWELFYDYGEDNGKKPVFIEGSRTQNSTVAIMEADFSAQGDAVEFSWSGEQPAYMGIGSKTYQEDLSRFGEQGVIQFDVRSIEPPATPIVLNVGCSNGYCKSIDISHNLPLSDGETWSTVTVPLQCFEREGLKLESVDAPFSLYSESKNRLRITNIVYLKKEAQISPQECE